MNSFSLCTGATAHPARVRDLGDLLWDRSVKNFGIGASERSFFLLDEGTWKQLTREMNSPRLLRGGLVVENPIPCLEL